MKYPDKIYICRNMIVNERVGSSDFARRPLAVGNIYRFKGYKSNGFKITAMSLPGTPSDDGALPGVALQWLNKSRFRGWYPFKSETEFWQHILFKNACDPEHA